MSQIFARMATDVDKFAAIAGVSAEEFAVAYRKSPMEALGLLMKKLAEVKDTVEFQKSSNLSG